MSGPKTSRYTLTKEQRRILREQLERERRTQEEKTKINRYISELRTICASFDEPLEQVKELQKRTNEGKEYISQVENLCVDIQQKIESNSLNDKELTLERLEIHNKSLEAYLKKIMKKADMLTEKAKDLKKNLIQDIQNGIDEGFLLEIPTNIGKVESDKDSKLSETMLTKLSEMSENQVLPQTMRNDIMAAMHKIREISDIGFLQNYKAMTFTELVKQYNKYIISYQNEKETYDDLIVRYSALCNMVGITIKKHTFSDEAISNLKLEIEQIEKQLVEQREESYINSCMDEVMAEMGYELLGDRKVTKRSGKKFKNELYSFNEGNAINVTYASDGNITMELGGVDKQDRLPDDAEINRLCEDMESFCEDFTGIEKKLSEKGVIISNRVCILPPKPEYAQVINTSDYNIKSDMEIEIMKAKKRKVSAGNKKTLERN
ncbi:hypothetical protein [Clostridium drakei]|uniref:Uncharacterized protein n=1 Tax=Clostridium drakei TaxID=332101 RepID=A0A2U8DRE9_9CLOT|nr:hypothetical protein [Clostridium drakei]AWI05025.1 hypothetical protein B9W14_11120 [Clostridium drakei]